MKSDMVIARWSRLLSQATSQHGYWL